MVFGGVQLAISPIHRRWLHVKMKVSSLWLQATINLLKWWYRTWTSLGIHVGSAQPITVRQQQALYWIIVFTYGNLSYAEGQCLITTNYLIFLAYLYRSPAKDKSWLFLPHDGTGGSTKTVPSVISCSFKKRGWRIVLNNMTLLTIIIFTQNDIHFILKCHLIIC